MHGYSTVLALGVGVKFGYRRYIQAAQPSTTRDDQLGNDESHGVQQVGNGQMSLMAYRALVLSRMMVMIYPMAYSKAILSKTLVMMLMVKIEMRVVIMMMRMRMDLLGIRSLSPFKRHRRRCSHDLLHSRSLSVYL